MSYLLGKLHLDQAPKTYIESKIQLEVRIS